MRSIPGLAICAAVAVAALALARIDWLASHGLGALTLSIVIGIVIGNTVYPRIAHRAGPGIAVGKQTLLRAGIVLYGLRLTLQDVGHVGVAGVAIDATVLATTFVLAVAIGTRWLKLDRDSAILIGAGSAICGAAAVMATEPVVKARAEQVTVAVATVVVFGTLGIFLYPQLHALAADWSLFPREASAFGVYAGSTIHEVAQVVAAAGSVGREASDTAVIAKMVRVMMLAPFLLILSVWLARRRPAEGPRGAGRAPVAIPWFALAFVAVVLFNSLQLLPSSALAIAADVDTALLAMAMAALGVSTHLRAIRAAGVRPLVLAGILFGWLVIGGAAINRAGSTLLG